MEADELAQHVLRVSKDALAVFEQMRARLIRQDAEMAELRDEVLALSNRIEGVVTAVRMLNREVTGFASDELHSVKVPEREPKNLSERMYGVPPGPE